MYMKTAVIATHGIDPGALVKCEIDSFGLQIMLVNIPTKNLYKTMKLQLWNKERMHHIQ